MARHRDTKLVRRLLLAVGLLFTVALLLNQGLALASGPLTLPERLADQEFWRLSQDFSEPGGTFHSDNFVSNEGRFQLVIPDLVHRTKPGGLYIGVGPEQNFSYIAATRPAMAFIVDIRRGNLHEHLLYKALFEMSATRVDFLSRLFSREKPAGLSPAATPQQLFAAFDAVRPTDARYRQNLAAVIEWLTKKHGLPLSAEDREGIDYVYRTAFFADGPELGYQLTGTGRTTQHPTYAQMMSTDDGQGRQRSYLAREEPFQFMKDLEARNLLVPVVGDFGGPKALRAVGRYAKAQGAIVSAFYLSNVEQYLRQDLKTGAFCANVAAMPLDASSTFIRSMAGRGFSRSGSVPGGLGMFSLSLGEMQAEVKACAPVAGGGARR
ncbi:MAG: hypothetical protein ABI051_10665 [Vicinamibacterales bacterium]